MRKILGLTVAAFLVMGLVGGGTWAYFSDTETSTGNIFTAGTLDIGLANATSGAQTGNTTATFSASAWKPGETTGNTALWINNNGDFDLSTVTIDFDYTSVDTSGRPTNITDTYGNNPGTTWDQTTDDFAQMIVVNAASWNGTAISGITAGTTTLADLKSNGPFTLPDLGGGVSLGAGEELNLVMDFEFDALATNGCQGNTVDVTITVVGSSAP